MLTARKVETAELPAKGGKPYKLSDTGRCAGLYLLVTPSGRYWRFDYRLNGKRRTYNIGTADKVSLKLAREAAEKARVKVRDGVDPVLERQRRREAEEKEREARRQAAQKEGLRKARTFEAAARMWLEEQTWAPSHRPKAERRIEMYLLPKIGNTPVEDLERNQIHDLLKEVAKGGTIDTAKRVFQYTRAILEKACDAGWLKANPAPSRMKWPYVESRKMPAIIDPIGVGQLLRDIDTYRDRGSPITYFIMRIHPYVATREGELGLAEWQEIDWENRLWIIPARHRKLKTVRKHNPDNVHVIPLSRQVIEMLEELHEITGGGRYLFPSAKNSAETISVDTERQALIRLGYHKRHVPHGWRSSFSSLMAELGFNKEEVEISLSHGVKGVRGDYMWSPLLARRRELMQQWADYLDGLRAGAQVIPINRKQA